MSTCCTLSAASSEPACLRTIAIVAASYIIYNIYICV